MMKERILIFVNWYAPGFMGGGQIRSCVNLSEHLKNDFEIFVFTSDRDLSMDKPYENIIADRWEKSEGVNIYYGSPAKLTWNNIVFQIRDNIRPHYIYVNGIFSRIFSVYPVLINRIYKLNSKFIVAPRGMLKETALQFKKKRKNSFLKVLKFLNVYKNITFHATDETERLDIKNISSKDTNILVIPNFSATHKQWIEPPLKNANQLSIIFIGRAHPIKNLHLVLEWLPQVGGEITLTIVTTNVDAEYWDKCKHLINRFPTSIQVFIHKDVPHAEVEKLIIAHHIFTLPTEGENFGHAIFEALSLGRPVIISDQTPWKELEHKKVGWEISLSQSQKFIEAYRIASSWNQQELNIWSKNAWHNARLYAEDKNIKTLYLKLFSNN